MNGKNLIIGNFSTLILRVLIGFLLFQIFLGEIVSLFISHKIGENGHLVKHIF